MRRRRPAWTLLLLSFLCALPASSARAGKVSELLSRLRSDDVFERQQAEAELRRLDPESLLSLAQAYGRDTGDGIHIELKLSQQALGEMVGTSRESVNKQLREWSEAGLVRAQRSSITLLDTDGLEDLAEQLID